MPPSRFRGSSRRGPRYSARTTRHVVEESSSEDARSDSGASVVGNEVFDNSPVIPSPSKLNYKVDHLPEDVQDAVRATFRTPPQMTVEVCRSEPNACAFQMEERVKRSVKFFGNRQGYSCTCGAAPCSHGVWLMDKVTKEILYHHDPNDTLTLTPQGHTEETGSLYEAINNFDIDLLADSLHCRVMATDSREEMERKPDPRRVLESRELLAAAQNVKDIENYRPDIFDNPRPGTKPIKRGDLECTISRLLWENDPLFNLMKDQSPRKDPINNPIRKLDQRVRRIFQKLESYCYRVAAEMPGPSSPVSGTDTVHNVAWAAQSITGVVKKVHFITTREPLTTEQRSSAAQLLIYILIRVSDYRNDLHRGPTSRDRNLFFRLIGDQDTGFILNELDSLEDVLHNQSFFDILKERYMQFVEAEVPSSYCEHMARLLNRIHSRPQSSSA